MQKLNDNGKITIAIPRPKNRGFESIKCLLEDCRIRFDTREDGFVPTSNPNFEVCFLPPKDIPKYVMEGVPLGICGEDMLAEARADALKLARLGGKVRVSVAAKGGIADMEALNGLRIGTALPNITNDFLETLKIKAEIIALDGALENALLLNTVDAIVDQVATGSSLRKNGLKEIAKIMDTELCLIGNKEAYEKSFSVVEPLKKMIESVLAGKSMNYVIFNAPMYAVEGVDAAVREGRIPCSESPTKEPLLEKGAYAYSIAIADAQLMGTLWELENLGARDILVLDVKSYSPGRKFMKSAVQEKRCAVQLIGDIAANIMSIDNPSFGTWEDVWGLGKYGTMESIYAFIMERKLNPKEGSGITSLLSSKEKLSEKFGKDVSAFFSELEEKQTKYARMCRSSDAICSFMIACASAGLDFQQVRELASNPKMKKTYENFDLAPMSELKLVAADAQEDIAKGALTLNAAAGFLFLMECALENSGISMDKG